MFPHRIIRWGIGHSTGLLLVGGVFIFKDYLQSRDNNNGSPTDDDDPIDIPDAVGHFFESLVGLFMIVMGVHGLRSALQKRRRELQGMLPLDDDDVEGGDVRAVVGESVASIEGPRSASPHQPYRDDASEDEEVVDVEQTTRPSSFHDALHSAMSPNSMEFDSHHHESDQPFHVRWTRKCSTKTLALFAGIVHGLAGPGGVLGIVPAVQLHNWKLASCYLGTFCLSSTLTMGGFACTYGTLSTFLGHKQNWEFQIQCFSAMLCLAVGITWLVLLSLGKLEDVFP